MKARSFLLAVLAILLPLASWAEEYTATIDGIRYKLTYVSGKVQSAIVVGTSIGKYYYEDINLSIPSTITYQDVIYKVDSIGTGAFSDSPGLASVIIPSSVTSIGYRAFKNCTDMTSVTIPNSVTSIGDEAFFNCQSLHSINITDIESWCKIVFCGFSSNPFCSSSETNHLCLNGVEIKDLVIPSSVTSIGDHAFRYCSGLTSVTIPNSVTLIGDQTFSACI